MAYDSCNLSDDDILMDDRSYFASFPASLSNKLKGIPSWSNLSGLGKNPILKSSWVWMAIVPVAASLLSKVDEVRIGSLGDNFVLNIALPFSWHVFFLSALFFSVGYAIYAMCCPAIIRKYNRFSELKDELQAELACSNAIYYWHCMFLAHDKNKGPKEVDQALANFCGKFGECENKRPLTLVTSADEFRIVDEDNFRIADASLADAFRKTWLQGEHSNYIARWICAFAYTTGTLLLGIVVIQNIAFVADSFLDHLYSDNRKLAISVLLVPFLVASGIIALKLTKSK